MNELLVLIGVIVFSAPVWMPVIFALANLRQQADVQDYLRARQEEADPPRTASDIWRTYRKED